MKSALRLVVIAIVIVSAVGAFAPLPAFADASTAGGTHNLFPSGYWGPLLSCTGSPESTGGAFAGKITNPCTSLCDLFHTVQHFVYFGMTLVLFILTPVLVIWGGFLIVTAGASSENLNKGKSVLKGTVIGALIALGAFLIVNTFLWVIGLATGSGSPTGEGKLAWPTIQCTPPGASAPPPGYPPRPAFPGSL